MNSIQLPVGSNAGVEPLSDNEKPVERDLSSCKCVFTASCLSLCIIVDILQYSMPLAFLPSVLEDRGHRSVTIATAIGVYYWTGFAGGILITGYQVYRLLYSPREPASDSVDLTGTVKREVRYLIFGLGVGTITLLGQAMHPHCFMHTVCRFAQGLAGAFIFFYAFLLCVSMFRGCQQVFAVTMASTALNVAEILGSSLGAWLFHNYGQRAVFWVLGFISIANQLLLVGVLCSIRPSADDWLLQPLAVRWPSGSPMNANAVDLQRGWWKLYKTLSNPRCLCAIILIGTAGMVKASMEEVLPFHADHRWGLDPLQIGNLFSVVAVSYISAAVVVGYIWNYLGECSIIFCMVWLVALGVTALGVLLTASVYKHEVFLITNLVAYGISLGFTQTPAALLLKEVVDKEEGRAKNVVNGVWNTMWEAGGSLGFLVGGFFAEDYWHQILLFAAFVLCCIFSCFLMHLLGGTVSYTTRMRLEAALQMPNKSKEHEKLNAKPWEPAYGSISRSSGDSPLSSLPLPS